VSSSTGLPEADASRVAWAGGVGDVTLVIALAGSIVGTLVSILAMG
jgi:hypothetical protein